MPAGRRRYLVAQVSNLRAPAGGSAVGRGFHAPPISSINGAPPFHPNCVHVLTPVAERLATEEERKAGLISPELLHQMPAELQRWFRKESPDIAGRAGRRSVDRKRLFATRRGQSGRAETFREGEGDGEGEKSI